MLLLRGAHILSFDDNGTAWSKADILVEQGKIAAIGPDLVPPEGPVEVVEAAGKLAIPGLINAHLHSPANLMKGLLEGAPLEIFMLYEVPPLAAIPDRPEVVRLRTLLGAAEMLKFGITTVHDDAFFVPVPTPATIDALMGAYRESGMRATVALDQPNVPELDKLPYLADLLPQAERAALEAARPQGTAALLDLYQGFVARWHGAEGGRLRCSVSCSAPQRITLDYFQALSGLAHEYDLAFNIHMLETRLQRVLGEEKWGRSLVAFVDELGLLDEHAVVIHAIWVDAADIERLARSGATVAHNPVCNLKLGSGIMPFRALADAGVPICLGTDEAAADDTLDLWGAIKTAGLVHKITDADYRRWPKAAEIMDCVYRGGARSLRQADAIGALEPGRAADIVLLDLDSLAFQPLNDPVRQLVYGSAGRAVTDVFVGGRHVVRDGRLTTLDEAALRQELAELMPTLRRQQAEVDAVARRFEPFYRAMYEKSLTHDVSMSRWAGNLDRD
jgi:5-methylthioadenosine/S-adenosylhomocysteine deaminase